ncbi:hypothetical protein PM085_19330 [Halorubrum ezzemoulense]|uniref:Uncharacterized protein n=1 Tax=Halorubrum ezzemoulense TaxID=337243 RepID=A0ABT4Z857_HALEZ|nr:hypothetical protein [Halorubrum ezzemoulense]MDB2294365.1 hypothetical protein [Halorubrum ezzemoulense]
MQRTKTIKIRVTPGDKKKFEDYLEQTRESSSLSAWFRWLGHNRIESEDKTSTAEIDPEQVTNAVEIGVSDLTERTEELAGEIALLENQVKPTSEIEELAKELLELLPIHPDNELTPVDQITKGLDELEGVQQTTTPSAWSVYLNEPEPKIRRALKWLSEFPEVKSTKGSLGITRWYRTQEVAR